MGNTVTFKRPDGKELQGYLAEPANATNAPGVVVIQEWWGLNDQIRGVADRLAQAGYVALVPDLYRGKATLEAAEANHLMSGLDFGVAAGQDVRGAAQFLKQRAAKVGCVGFCMGGALTLLAAANAPELDAAVTFYGCPPLDYLDASKITIPLQGHWASLDDHFPTAQIDGLAKKLAEAKVSFDSHTYVAEHAFANEQAVGEGRMATTHYDPVFAQRAFDRTFSFFGQHLR